MKCTIQSIADELELSRNTVARVLSGKDGVSAKTRKLVLKKAEEMGYGISVSDLPKRQTPQIPESIVFLTSSAGSPEARAAIIQAAEEYLKKQNSHLILAVIDTYDFPENTAEQSFTLKKDPQFPAVLYSPSVRGICMIDIWDERIYDAVIPLKLPTAAILSTEQAPVFTAFPDSFCDRIDILTANPRQYLTRLTASVQTGNRTSVQFISCRDDLSQLLKQESIPDFFLCEDDWTAIHLMQTAQTAGYSIPEDFSVIGCGNIPESAHTFPALTTIQIPWSQMGTAAARCITDRIRDPELSCVSVSFTSRLIERSSAIL